MGTLLTLDELACAGATPGGGSVAAALVAARLGEDFTELVIARRPGNEAVVAAAEEVLTKYTEGLKVTGKVTLYALEVGSPDYARCGAPVKDIHRHGDVCGKVAQFISLVSGLMTEFGLLVCVGEKRFYVHSTIRRGGGEDVAVFYGRLQKGWVK